MNIRGAEKLSTSLQNKLIRLSCIIAQLSFRTKPSFSCQNQVFLTSLCSISSLQDCFIKDVVDLLQSLLQAMGCCGIKGDKEGEEDDKRARKQNKEIEKQIQKDKQVILDLVPMLILNLVLLMMEMAILMLANF